MQYKNALALRVSLETGLRIDDVLSIRTSGLDKRTLYGVAKKTKKSFRKVISADLANRLKEISGENFIFEGRLDKNKHRTRQAVFKDVKKAARVLNLHGNIAPHSARKTYAVEKFHESGIGAVKKELQHSDINTTVLYAFADYLNELPAASNKCSTPKEQGKAAEKGAAEGAGAEVPTLDGDFWLTFADLVAEKTATKLLQILKRGGHT